MSEQKKSKPIEEDAGEKEVISKNPNLELAQLRFLLSHPDYAKDKKELAWEQLLQEIKENDMAPLYTTLCEELSIPVDKCLLDGMKERNTKKIAEMEAEIADAEQNLGESEVRQAWLRKAEYFCQIGDKDAALTAFRHTYEKTVGMGYRIDLIFNLIRLGLFFLDHTVINTNIAKAKELMEQGGDWERKNRLRSYEALYRMYTRDLSGAADLFLEAVPTFGSYELMSYENLIFYTVVCTLHALDRPDLRNKVIRCNEIQEQVWIELTGGGTNGSLVLLRDYLSTYYECHYDRFFQCLAELEETRLSVDRYLSPHVHFYSRSMRLRAYEQFLTPYKTVRLQMMARDFGVSRAFIDGELHKLIAAGSLNCKIDAMRGVIEMNQPDSKNHLYKALIRDGDLLLNRIQKLERVINA